MALPWQTDWKRVNASGRGEELNRDKGHIGHWKPLLAGQWGAIMSGAHLCFLITKMKMT